MGDDLERYFRRCCFSTTRHHWGYRFRGCAPNNTPNHLDLGNSVSVERNHFTLKNAIFLVAGGHLRNPRENPTLDSKSIAQQWVAGSTPVSSASFQGAQGPTRPLLRAPTASTHERQDKLVQYPSHFKSAFANRNVVDGAFNLSPRKNPKAAGKMRQPSGLRSR